MSVLSVPIMIRGRHVSDTLRMPEAELRERWATMRALLARCGLDGVICYADSTCNGYVEYFTNYHCVQPFTNALLILPAEGDLCLVASVPGRDARRIQNGFIPADVGLLTVGMAPLANDHVGQKAAEYLVEKGLAGKRWGGINLSRCMKKTQDSLENTVAGMVDLTKKFEKMRAVKSVAEIGIVSQAASFARLAALDMARACVTGVDECTAAAQADRLIRCAGAEDVQLFIGSSETGGFLRAPRKRTAQNGEIIKVLCQVQYLRYRGVFATTVVAGTKRDVAIERIKDHHDRYARLLGRISSGAVLDDRWKAELGAEENTFSAIHGIGQDLVEPIPPQLEENMVMSVMWESNADSVLLADTVLCTKNGVASLSGQAAETGEKEVAHGMR